VISENSFRNTATVHLAGAQWNKYLNGL